MSGSGLFITFEGIDGCGKSSQSKLLSKALGNCVLTREPGGSDGAEIIRKLLVSGDTNRWSAETEILLFTAARRDHLERTIEPALSTGKTVISDRFADSTRVYQGVTRGDLTATVNTLHDLMIAREPDITFLIDIDPGIALTRGLARNSGEDRFEDFGLPFQQSLRAGFLSLAKQHHERFEIVNGHRSIEAIHEDILQRTKARFL